MILRDLSSAAAAAAAARECMTLAGALYPLCRSLAGPGVRRSLDLIGEWIPLERHEVSSGTQVYDWQVPNEWSLARAHITDTSTGRRIVDAQQHNLHVVNCSVPVNCTLSRADLEPHLHSLPDRPDWIPYRTSYYREDWGFCLRHRDRESLGAGPFEVVIESELRPGSLTYAECIVPGRTDQFGIVYVHTCHPSLANDNLSGMTVAAALARALRSEQPELTWRFVFGPGTIGSLVWLARNEASLTRLRGGLTLGLLGDTKPITYKRSRRGDTATDRVAELVLSASGQAHRVVDFEPYGYDERQFCSPGFDLPVGRLSRAQYGEYPEYHTSADNLSFLSVDSLADSVVMAATMLAAIDANRTMINLCPKGEPRLGKRGLYGNVGGQLPRDTERAMLWVLSYSDGRSDLVDVARRSQLPLHAVVDAAHALETAGLLAPAERRLDNIKGVRS